MFETHQGITSVPSGSGIGRRSDMYGGDPIPGYEFNYSMAGSWEATAPQPQSHSGYMRVSVFHTMAREGHPLILPSHEACSI